MFLSGILLAAAACWQEPQSWCTVTPADDDVAPATVTRIEADAAASLERLREVFRGVPREPFRIFVHRTTGSLPPAAAAGHHEGSPGLALLPAREIHLVLAHMPLAGTRPVVVHELVHILLDQYAAPWGRRLPRWFHEGLAQVLAGETYLDAHEEDLVWRVATGRLLAFFRLEDGFPHGDTELRVAYAQSYSYVAWLEREFGRAALLEAVRKVDGETSFLAGLVAVTHKTTIELEDGWADYLVHGSGASFRALLESCFMISMVLALPLVALASIRRLGSDRRARERLERSEAEPEPLQGPPPPPEPPEPAESEEPFESTEPHGGPQ